jgi:hypothetical protein
MQIEFWNIKKSDIFPAGIYMKRLKGEWTLFDELTPEEIEEIYCTMLKDYRAKRALLHLSKSFPGDKKRILKQFITCNWGKLDNKWDISDKKLQFEKAHCPFKISGNCPFKGKGLVCIKV